MSKCAKSCSKRKSRSTCPDQSKISRPTSVLHHSQVDIHRQLKVISLLAAVVLARSLLQLVFDLFHLIIDCLLLFDVMPSSVQSAPRLRVLLVLWTQGMLSMLVSTSIGMAQAIRGHALIFVLLTSTLVYGADMSAGLSNPGRLIRSGSGVPCVELTQLVQMDASRSELDLTGAILQRNINGNVVLQRAAVLLKDRLSDSGPLQEAAMDLLRICKSAKNLEDPKQARDLVGKAKKIYGVRAAMIDMDSASVSVPQGCSVLLNPGQRSWFHASKASLTNAASLPSTRELDSCLKELFQVDNMWTSFTSHRQDANTLCEVPGTENASRMIVELLNDVNSIIPEWVQTFRSEQEAHAAQLQMRMSFLRQIHDMEQQRKDDIQQERQDVREKMNEFQRIWMAQIEKLGSNANTKMTDLGGQVEQMRGVSDSMCCWESTDRHRTWNFMLIISWWRAMGTKICSLLIKRPSFSYCNSRKMA
jgi:hypothetical protein